MESCSFRAIQVGAFRNVQEKYLKDIEKRGFSYRLKVINKSNGSSITKVLIGPYDNKNEAREDLLKVKESVAKGAYLTKV
ncbi:MAG TPA: SPOR domain-containing protein [Anaerolineae bacterium]|nr:SPOR domain-containing protein [Anaerolineae bacterium]